MQDANTIARIRGKYLDLLDDVDERARRRWAAVEARDLGWGGVMAVATATGLSDRTIRNGIRELDEPEPLAAHRQRKSGGGRKPLDSLLKGLRQALEAFVEPTTRGSPANQLRWTINPKLGKAAPYGVNDIHQNEAGVSIGVSHDMPLSVFCGELCEATCVSETTDAAASPPTSRVWTLFCQRPRSTIPPPIFREMR